MAEVRFGFASLLRALSVRRARRKWKAALRRRKRTRALVLELRERDRRLGLLDPPPEVTEHVE
jgi:hypothetical protein